MSSTARVAKDPDDTEDFALDWSLRLVSGETISTAAAVVVDGAWAVSSTSVVDTTTTARMTGGVAATLCSVRWRITTSSGRQIDWTLYVPVDTQ